MWPRAPGGLGLQQPGRATQTLSRRLGSRAGQGAGRARSCLHPRRPRRAADTRCTGRPVRGRGRGAGLPRRGRAARVEARGRGRATSGPTDGDTDGHPGPRCAGSGGGRGQDGSVQKGLPRGFSEEASLFPSFFLSSFFFLQILKRFRFSLFLFCLQGAEPQSGRRRPAAEKGGWGSLGSIYTRPGRALPVKGLATWVQSCPPTLSFFKSLLLIMILF